MNRFEMPLDSATGDTRRRLVRGLLAVPAIAAVGGLAAGCASTATVPPPAGAEPLAVPALRVGDRWRYATINRYNGGNWGETLVEVTAVKPEIVVRITAPGGRPPVEERYADAFTVTRDATYDSTLDFASPMPIVPSGARTGLSNVVTSNYQTEVSTQERLAWRQQISVRGWERLTVPAGTFDALRVDRRIWFTHPDIFRMRSERVDSVWYAPQVGRWIAREWTGNYLPVAPSMRGARIREDWVRWELTGFERAAG